MSKLNPRKYSIIDNSANKSWYQDCCNSKWF